MTEILGVILLLAAMIGPIALLLWLISNEVYGGRQTGWKPMLRSIMWVLFAMLCAPLCIAVLLIRRYGALRGLLTALAIAALWVGVVVLGGWLALTPKYHETDSLADYRIITGNHNNERPQALIDSFFPEAIGADFTDPVWHYKAIRFDSVACEAYLEFTLPDEAAFAAHYAGLAQHGVPWVFPFDGRYEMWVIADHMDTWTREERNGIELEEPEGRNIESAKVGLILCDREAREFIYFALMVHEGGGTRTTDLNHFFTRFRIDPLAFEKMIAQ